MMAVRFNIPANTQTFAMEETNNLPSSAEGGIQAHPPGRVRTLPVHLNLAKTAFREQALKLPRPELPHVKLVRSERIRGSVRRRNDKTSVGLEDVPGSGEKALSVGKVLDCLKSNDHVECLPPVLGETFGIEAAERQALFCFMSLAILVGRTAMFYCARIAIDSDNSPSRPLEELRPVSHATPGVENELALAIGGGENIARDVLLQVERR